MPAMFVEDSTRADRFAANTLRTLGIVLISIFVIVGSLVLLLFALCMGALGGVGGSGHTDPQAAQLFIASIVVLVLLISLGVLSISKLAKGIRRDSVHPVPEYATAQPVASHADVTQPGLVEPGVPRSDAVSTSAVPSIIPPAPPEPRATIDVASHLSPASRTAIQQLVLAIVAKITAEIAIVLIGWFSTHRTLGPQFQTFRFSFLAWGAGAIAPHLVLIYALLRRPGPRAFAYSLVIPALHIFFGIFGHSASLIVLLRTPSLYTLLPALGFIPWLLDILILYLAWKAIHRTGILPKPTRLIVASAVIILYSTLLPFVVLLMKRVGS